jgi:hypothetical protein
MGWRGFVRKIQVGEELMEVACFLVGDMYRVYFCLHEPYIHDCVEGSRRLACFRIAGSHLACSVR